MVQSLHCIVLLVVAITFTYANEQFMIQSIDKPVIQAVKECGINEGAVEGRKFAYELFEVASSKFPKRNLFLAPSVVRMALALILHGAEGNTRTQIIEGLQFNETDFTEDNLRCLLHMYSEGLDGESKKKEGSGPAPLVIKRAGKVFGERSFAFNEEFVEKTNLQREDFINSTEETRIVINDWVKEATNNKIINLFKEDDISADTKLAVVSAIYFQGNWKYPFNKKDNYNYTFNLMGGETITTEYMNHDKQFRYYWDKTYRMQATELPYKDDPTGKYEISMILLVPDSMEEWQTNNLKLTEEYLGGKTGIITQLLSKQLERVRIVLPKFRLAPDYNLKTLLSRMGMSDMFSPRLADLSRAVDEEGNASPPLFVDTAVHKTWIKVDEYGTEAAGATGFSIQPLSLPPSVMCNKPFFTIIYEKNAKEILFIGRIMDPSKTG